MEEPWGLLCSGWQIGHRQLSLGEPPSWSLRSSSPLKMTLLGKPLPDKAGTPQLAAGTPAASQWVAVGSSSSSSGEGAVDLGLRTGVPVHGALASVPGQQLPIEDPGERHPLPPGPLGLLQEHEVVV